MSDLLRTDYKNYKARPKMALKIRVLVSVLWSFGGGGELTVKNKHDKLNNIAFSFFCARKYHSFFKKKFTFILLNYFKIYFTTNRHSQ